MAWPNPCAPTVFICDVYLCFVVCDHTELVSLGSVRALGVVGFNEWEERFNVRNTAHTFGVEQSSVRTN